MDKIMRLLENNLISKIIIALLVTMFTQVTSLIFGFGMLNPWTLGALLISGALILYLLFSRTRRVFQSGLRDYYYNKGGTAEKRSR